MKKLLFYRFKFSFQPRSADRKTLNFKGELNESCFILHAFTKLYILIPNNSNNQQ